MKICTECRKEFRGRGYRCDKCRLPKLPVDLHPHKISLRVDGPYTKQRSAPEAWFYRNPKTLDIHIQVNETDGMKHYSFEVPR